MRSLLKLMMVMMLLVSVDSASAAKKEATPKAPKEKKAKGPKAPKVAPQELTVTGVVTAAGKGYVLTTDAGAKIKLPAKGVEQLADMAGKSVKIVGMGTETKKGDKIETRISKVISVSAAKAAGGDEGGMQEDPIEEGGGGFDNDEM